MSLIINDVPQHSELFYYVYKYVESQEKPISENDLREFIDPHSENNELDRTLSLLETLGLLLKEDEVFSCNPKIEIAIRDSIDFKLAFLSQLWKEKGANSIIRPLYLYACYNHPVFRCAEDSDPIVTSFNRWLDGEGKAFQDRMTTGTKLEGRINNKKAEFFGRLITGLGLAIQVHNRVYMTRLLPALLFRAISLVIPPDQHEIPISTMLESINDFIPVEPSKIHTSFATALWQLIEQKKIELHHVPDRYSEAGKAAQTYDLLSNDQTNGVMMQARIGGAYNEIRLPTD